MLAGWQIEEMEAAAASRQWEELNAPDPNEEQLIEAAKEIESVLKDLDQVTDSLLAAEEILDGTPMAAVIASYRDQVDDVAFSLRVLSRNYREGIRE